MSTRREVLRSAGGLGLLGVLGACSTAAPSQSETTPPADKITVGVGSLGQQIVDPQTNGDGQGFRLRWAIGDELARLDDGKFVPNLATSWTQSADGLKWSLTLRSGVKMHDGSTFTARDIKSAIDRARQQNQAKNPRFSTANPRILTMDVRVIDDTHVDIVHQAPYPNMLTDAGFPGPIPTDYYNKVGEDTFQKMPVGAGPFKFVSQEINQSVTFERFGDFWDKARLPNFKTLVYRAVPEESARLAGLQSGILDLVETLSAAGVAELQGNQKARVLTAEAAGNCGAFFYDVAKDPKSPFLDLRVRQALLYALDREAIAKSVFKGLATVPASIMGGTGDSTLKAFPYDPGKARQLLRDAGRTDLSFNIWSPIGIAGADETMGAALAGYWDAVGVKAKVKPVDQGQYQTARNNLQVDGIGLINRQWLIFLDPSLWSTILSGVGAPRAGFVDKELDAKATQWTKTIDLDARARMAREVERYIYDQTLAVPTVFLSAVFGAGPHVEWKPQMANPYAGPVWYMRSK